jgi:hypothetical protein
MNGFRPEVRSWNPATGAWGSMGNTGVTRYYGTSFLLPLQNTTTEKGKILVCCGSDNITSAAKTSAQIIDFNAGNPLIRTVASSAFARLYLTPVILPDGKCVVFGGTQLGNSNPVLAPESFDPVTETWQTLPASTIPRYYHTTALLLPDGRVWVAGGTRVSSTFEPRTEFFSPSYMTQTRPTMSVPTVGAYGGSINIPTPNAADISSVSLVRLMNTTHHYDANQRLVWLQIASRGSSNITVSAPINANIAPPGYYMIHILNSSGIPSAGSIIKIPGAASTPDTTIPNLAITSPATGSTLPPGSVLVQGTASDNTGGSGVRDVRVRVDTGAYVTATPQSPGNWSTWSITVSITAEGSHTITANCRDNAGNFTTRGSNITISSAPPDTTIPNLAITSPATGSTLPPGSVLVQGTASDNTGGSGVRDVRVRVDTGAYVTATPQSPGNWSTWSITVSITAVGSHTITANCRDNAGNFRTRGSNITIA